jgi:TPR repeat protein
MAAEEVKRLSDTLNQQSQTSQSEAASSVPKAKTDAELYYEGQRAHDNKEFNRSFQIFLPLAEKGMGQAQFMLYAQYYLGEGVERDLGKSVFWLEKAKENGNETAKELLPKVQMELAAQLNEEAVQAMNAGDSNKQRELMKKQMHYASEAAKQGLPIAICACAISDLIHAGNKEGTEMARFKAKQSLQEVAGQTEDLKAQELAKQALREYF